MKVNVWISATLGKAKPGVFTSNVIITEDQLEQLCAVFPQGRGRGGFSAEIAEEDPRYTKVVSLITEWTGRTPKHRSGPLNHSEYGVFRAREFTSKELESYQYFYMVGRKWIADLDARTIDGQLIVRMGSVHPAYGIGAIPPSPAIGVSDEVKAALLQENFSGIRFKEILQSKKRRGQKELSFQSSRKIDLEWANERAEIYDHSTATSILWQILGLVKLPPCKNRVVDGDSRLIESGPRKNCFIVDEAHPPVLTYARADIESLPEFDVAETQETIGNGERNDSPFVIVSKRFMQWVRNRKLKGVGFIPVSVQE